MSRGVDVVVSLWALRVLGEGLPLSAGGLAGLRRWGLLWVEGHRALWVSGGRQTSLQSHVGGVTSTDVQGARAGVLR